MNEYGFIELGSVDKIIPFNRRVWNVTGSLISTDFIHGNLLMSGVRVLRLETGLDHGAPARGVGEMFFDPMEGLLKLTGLLAHPTRHGAGSVILLAAMSEAERFKTKLGVKFPEIAKEGVFGRGILEPYFGKNGFELSGVAQGMVSMVWSSEKNFDTTNTTWIIPDS